MDLSRRLEEGLATDERIALMSCYRGAPLPGWLATGWQTTLAGAGDNRMPCLVINVKGLAPADSLCVMRLADLERLLQEQATHGR